MDEYVDTFVDLSMTPYRFVTTDPRVDGIIGAILLMDCMLSMR